jgi:hypothetical protein
MRKKVFFSALVLLGLALLAGCSGGSSVAPLSSGSAVSLSFRDAAPSGTSVLSFEVTITSATLQPGNIQLVNAANPPEFEFTQLQTEKAFVSTTRVSPGTYTLSLTFANPELTFQNTSPNPVSFANCVNVPPQGICELKPATTSLTASAPNVNVVANGATGLEVDLDLSKVIQSDFSLNFQAGLSVTQVNKPTENEEMEELDDIVGRVQSVGTNQFVLQPLVGQAMTINVDPATTKFDFKNTCLANNFSCLKPMQVVEVDLSLMGGGPPFLAKEVELVEDVNQEDLSGTIVTLTGNPPTQFTLVLHDDELIGTDANKVAVGNQVAVTIDALATFQIDRDGLNVPATLFFASPSDLLPGQEVEVELKLGTAINPGPPISITASRITLERSQMTGQVLAPAGSSFTLTGLSSPFPASVMVDASQAKFENVSGVSGLSAGDTVSVKGLLFGPTASPTLVAQKVRKR